MCRSARTWPAPAELPRPDVITDDDRRRAVDVLRDHFTAGRLDVDEFSSRLDEVWAATTADQLDAAFRELPPPAPAAGPVPWHGSGWQAPVRRFGPPPLVWVALAILGIVGFLALWPAWAILLVVWLVFVRPHRRAWRHYV